MDQNATDAPVPVMESNWRTGSPHRRNRAILACLPCHQRKVKCDRGHPCKRCVVAGDSSKCVYQPTKPQWPLETGAVTRAEFSTIGVFVNGKARLGHANSWMRLCWDFEEARDYLFGLDAEYKPLYERIKQLRGEIKSRSLKRTMASDLFTAASPHPSNVDLLSQLPSPEIVTALLQNYMQTINSFLPLFDELRFSCELAQFWERPEIADPEFFMQLFLMIAMSCHSMSKNCAGLSKANLDEMLPRYMGIGETMIRMRYRKAIRGLPGLRVLCIIVAARVMGIYPFYHTPDSVVLLGTLVRAAQKMNLHRHPRNFAGILEGEAHSRLLIWSVIFLLDGITSIHSCLPPLICEGDYDAAYDYPIGDPNISSPDHMDETVQNDTNKIQPRFLNVLWELLPILSNLLKKLNSVKPKITPSEVNDMEMKLRSILRKWTEYTSGTKLEGNIDIGVSLQGALLETLIRRVLINLHQPFIHNFQSEQSERSRLIVQECALALILRHETLYESMRSNRQAYSLFDILKEDFGITLIHLALGLRRGYFDNSELEHLDGSPGDIAWIALQRATDLTETKALQSVRHFQIHVGAVCIRAALEAFKSNRPLRDEISRVTSEIIDKMARLGVGVVKETSSALSDDTDMVYDEYEGYSEDMDEDFFLFANDYTSSFLTAPCFFTI